MSQSVPKILIATRNHHKVAEIRAILGDQFQYVTLENFPNAPVVVEDAPDFAGNATKKATELARWIGSHISPADASTTHESPPHPGPLPRWGRGRSQEDEPWVLADDSGLEVDALHGAPGVHSARFAALDSQDPAAGNSPDSANNAKLLRVLRDFPLEKRTARFRCVVAITPVVGAKSAGNSSVCLADEAELRTELFTGTCEGHIVLAPRGMGGFGYDPLFVPRGYDQSFAELGEEVKNRLSHRAQALRLLREWLNKQ